ncbi:MAG: hypothetical protein IKO35_06215 [Elusimicrobiaceae bacterium]|nr:hypothetical protein [Elusimicrobiaceae bacterium]
MKKWAKYLILTGCIALFLFLILPFLEPPSINSASLSAKQKATEPQIFTSNPLTQIVSRIWGALRQQQNSQQIAQLAKPQTNTGSKSRSAYHPEDASAYAAQPGQNQTTDSYSPENEEETDNNDIAAVSAATQAPTEEWFLIRQQTPQASNFGMHEINVRDNAYDRYVKQERAARLAPATQMQQQAAVPDSKLARLFSPIKRFFGFNDATPVQTGSLLSGPSYASAKRLGSSSGLDRNRAKQTRNLPKAQAADITVSARNTFQNTYPSGTTLADLINPDRTIRESADMIANSLPNGIQTGNGQVVTPQEIREAKQEEFRNRVNERLQERLVRLAEGAEPQDQIPNVAKCDIRKGFINHDEKQCHGPSPEDIDQLRQQNQEAFLAKTHIPLPPTKLLPVLSLADKNSINALQPDEIDEIIGSATSKQLYQFMESNCQGNNCYWLANPKQTEDGIKQTFEAAGVEFAGEPFGLEEENKQAYLDKYFATHPDMTDEEKQQLQQKVQEAALPYLSCNEACMSRLTDKNNPEKTTLYFASPADAKAFADKYGYDTPFFYSEQPYVVLTQDDSSLEQRSRTLNDSLANFVVFVGEVTRDIKQEAGKETVTNTVKPIIQKIQEDSAKERADFQNPFGQTKK